MKGYGPDGGAQSPRVAGVSTFLRLPHVTQFDDVDVAIVGLPFDTGLAVRTGARFGPRAVREASLTLHPAYNPAQRVAVFEQLSVVDAGDAHLVAGFTDRSLDSMRDTLEPVYEAGAVPLCIGGDHTVTLAELRAAAARHGPLALLHFGAHTDCQDEAEGRATCTARSCAAPRRRVSSTRRTPPSSACAAASTPRTRYEQARALGFTVVPWEDLAQLGTGVVSAAVEAVGERKAFVTVDVDFVDPGFAPAVVAPEVGGPSSAQALALIRGCRGLDLVGADVVEVVPELDSSNLTATVAATLAYELLSLMACSGGTCA